MWKKLIQRMHGNYALFINCILPLTRAVKKVRRIFPVTSRALRTIASCRVARGQQ